MTDLAAITLENIRAGAVWLLVLGDGYRVAVYHDGDPRWPYRAGRRSFETFADLQCGLRSLAGARDGVRKVVMLEGRAS